MHLLNSYIDNLLTLLIIAYLISIIYISALTLLGLLILPKKLLETPQSTEDENAELLRQVTVFKRRRPKKNH